MSSLPLVSVLINSLTDCSDQILASYFLHKANYLKKYDIEILVSGGVPKILNGKKVKELDYSKVTFVEDQGTSVASINRMFNLSRGDYILNLNGKILPSPNFFDLVDVVQKEEKNQEYFITGPSSPTGGTCVIPTDIHQLGDPKSKHIKPLDTRYSRNKSNRANIIRFPALSRRTVVNFLGGVIFNESFKHHYVDNWLGQYTLLKTGVYARERTEIRYLDGDSHPQVNKDDTHDWKVYYSLAKTAGLADGQINYNHEVTEESLLHPTS